MRAWSGMTTGEYSQPVRTICVLNNLVLSLVCANFAAYMRLITIFLLCIPLSGLSVQTKAQQAVFVYGKGTCTAVDVQNVNEIKMTEDVVDISLGVNYRCTDVDSITFREPEVDYGRIGWWGSSADGPSACYYQSFRKDHPDMIFEAAGSICTSAFYYLPDEESLLQSRRRVGRKWRYVKNTLSGRRKFQIHQQQADSDHTKMDENGLIYLDLTNQFCNRPVIEARKTVNMWYHPQDTASMPKKPLFGTIERNSYDRSAFIHSAFIHYDVPLYGIDDSIHCHIFFWNDNGTVRGDSMRIVFPDHLLAEEEFELMDTEADESTQFFITDNTIYIVEEFEATIDDVLRWLIRFDLDVCKPIYIREEE